MSLKDRITLMRDLNVGIKQVNGCKDCDSLIRFNDGAGNTYNCCGRDKDRVEVDIYFDEMPSWCPMRGEYLVYVWGDIEK